MKVNLLRLYDAVIERLLYWPLWRMAIHTWNERWQEIWMVVARHRSAYRTRMKQRGRKKGEPGSEPARPSE